MNLDVGGWRVTLPLFYQILLFHAFFRSPRGITHTAFPVAFISHFLLLLTFSNLTFYFPER